MQLEEGYTMKVIIIGAGIIGSTAAYKLSKQGAEVTVIDRNENGKATDAAAGIVCPWLTQRRNKAWYQLAKGGAKIYPSLMAELEEDGETETGYSKVGAITIRNIDQKLDTIYQLAVERRKDAPEIGEVSRLNPTETKKLFPLVQDGYSSIHVSGAARVKGRQLREALQRAAKKHGAAYITGNATLTQIGNQQAAVELDGRQIQADIIIAANGAWMKELMNPLGIDLNAYPQKGQIIHLSMEQQTKHFPVVMPPNNLSIVPFKDRLVIGATHEDDSGFDYRLTAGGVHEILSKAMEVAPGIKDFEILETRVGFRPFTPGSMPIAGPVPNFKGLYAANGLGSSGLTTGPYLATELVQAILGKETEIDLSHYDLHHAVQYK